MRRLVIVGMVVAVVFIGCVKDDPTPPPTPTGSCCDARSASCEVTIVMDCTDSAMLTWTEGGACTPNPCPPPPGSCCTPEGTCTVTTHAACLGQQRTWIPYHFCSPNPCLPLTGACCTPEGTCTVTTHAACGGTWTTGRVCTPNPCAFPTGSCCAVNGTCTVTTEAICTGSWTGAGGCAPNPCVQPTGSCCAFDGTCTVRLRAACTGTWTEAGVCTSNSCIIPPDMARIPPGNARLGQTGFPEPVADFYIAGFYIDIYEVSNAKYKAFIDANGYTTEAYWSPVGWAWRVANSITLPQDWNNNRWHGGGIAGNERYPVNGVSWFEADAYCRWAGGRLPTSAEWEKAAKGGCETHGDPGQCDASDTPTYPWGEGLSGPRANYESSGDPYENNGWTTPVGYYDGSNHDGYQTINSPSPYGLYDVAGNVWEWCSTKFPNLYNNPNDGWEDPPATYNDTRIIRGGAWCQPIDDAGGAVGCAFAPGSYPSNRGGDIGFRCAKAGS